MKSAIIIMAKAPIAGTVKTRLIPFLTARQAAQFAECLLEDTVNKVKALQNHLIIAYSPAGQIGFFERFASSSVVFIEQVGDTLGDKIHAAFQFAFAQDLDSVVMIGTDSPTFPPEFIRQAFDFLETGAADAVLGKSMDGGFYLIGLRALQRDFFENVDWSSPRTFEQTVHNIKKSGLQTAEIPLWYDVDDPADFKRLTEEFRQNPSAQEIAPLTFEWLEQNARRATDAFS